jgi:hypothetical protein
MPTDPSLSDGGCVVPSVAAVEDRVQVLYDTCVCVIADYEEAMPSVAANGAVLDYALITISEQFARFIGDQRNPIPRESFGLASNQCAPCACVYAGSGTGAIGAWACLHRDPLQNAPFRAGRGSARADHIVGIVSVDQDTSDVGRKQQGGGASNTVAAAFAKQSKLLF